LWIKVYIYYSSLMILYLLLFPHYIFFVCHSFVLECYLNFINLEFTNFSYAVCLFFIIQRIIKWNEKWIIKHRNENNKFIYYYINIDYIDCKRRVIGSIQWPPCIYSRGRWRTSLRHPRRGHCAALRSRPIFSPQPTELSTPERSRPRPPDPLQSVNRWIALRHPVTIYHRDDGPPRSTRDRRSRGRTSPTIPYRLASPWTNPRRECLLYLPCGAGRPRP